MYSYNDARDYREHAGLPLTWDDDIPPPPLDRIEFTRLVLNAAEESGLGHPVPEQSVCPDESDASRRAITAFRVRLDRDRLDHDHVLARRRSRRQKLDDVPIKVWRFSGMNGPGGSGYRLVRWDEYLPRLEDSYFYPWKIAWTFGPGAGSEEHIWEALSEKVNRYTSNLEYRESPPSDRDYTNSTPRRSDVIAHYLIRDDLYSLAEFVDGRFRMDSGLTDQRFLGIRMPCPIFLPPLFGFLAFARAMVGVVKGQLSGWQFFWIIVGVLFGMYCLAILVCYLYRPHWLHKSLTFGELATQIVATKRQDWEKLQYEYALDSDST